MLIYQMDQKSKKNMKTNCKTSAKFSPVICEKDWNVKSLLKTENDWRRYDSNEKTTYGSFVKVS